MVQNRTPPGGHLGMVSERSGGDEVLETGTLSREWNLAKELPLGPKGLYGTTCSSEAKTDVPSLVCAVTTRRGGAS